MAATGKQVSAILKPNQYWAAPRPHLPCFSVEEQWAAIALYRELAKGEPVDDTRLAWTLWLSITETARFLSEKRLNASSTPGSGPWLRRPRGDGHAPSLRGGRPRALDMVRLGQPVPPRNPGTSRARVIGWSGKWRNCPPCRYSRAGRVSRTEWHGDFLHSARRARLWHVRRQCDG